MRTRRSGESALLLLDAIDVLVSQKIRYAVVGAIAASIHGAVRASMDADVVLSLAVQDAKELEQTFKAANFHSELTRGDFDDPIPALLKLSDTYGNRVDLLIGLKGMEAGAFGRIVEVPFQGQKVRFIGREDFIAMKAFAGGPMDVVDATRAVAAAGGSLDKELLRRLGKQYGHEALQLIERLLAS
jgi:predicted nucleotidyltransferase